MNNMQCIVVKVPNLEIKTNTASSPHDCLFFPWHGVFVLFSVNLAPRSSKGKFEKNTVRLGTLRCLEMKSTSLRLNPELNRRSKPNLSTSVALWLKVEYPASS